MEQVYSFNSGSRTGLVFMRCLTEMSVFVIKVVIEHCAGTDSIVELLVKSGYDVNAQMPDGITALMIACRMVCVCQLFAGVDIP